MSQESDAPARAVAEIAVAVYDALARGDLGDAAVTADAHWGDLVRTAPGAIRAVAAALTPDERGVPGAQRAAIARVRELEPYVLGRPHALHDAVVTAPAERVETLTLSSVAHRAAGRFAEAAADAEEAEQLIARHPHGARHGATRFAADRLRRGRSLFLAMREERAREVFSLGYDGAVAEGDAPAAREAAADLALLDVVYGRCAVADEWITRAIMIARAQGLDARNPVLRLAQAQRALDRGDAAAALEATTPLAHEPAPELAILVACLRALALAPDRGAEGIRRALLDLETHLSATPIERRMGGLNRVWIASARIELRLRLGDLAAVRQEVDELESADGLGVVATEAAARLHYATCDLEAAFTAVSQVLRAPDVHRRPRAMTSATALLAAVCLRTGDLVVAREAYAHAEAIAREHGLPRELRVITPEDRKALRALVRDGVPAGPAERAGSPLHALATAAPERLTDGEAQVALAFAGGDAVRAIAEARGVSVNTVKTQLRNAYRKLGVERRDGLAREVRRLGLIPRVAEGT